MFKCLLKVKKVKTVYRSIVIAAVFNGTRNISLIRRFQIFLPSSALAPVPLASPVAQDPMSALRRPFFLAPCFAEVQTLSRARSVYILFIQANPLTLETFILFFGVEIAESGVLELSGRLFLIGVWSFDWDSVRNE